MQRKPTLRLLMYGSPSNYLVGATPCERFEPSLCVNCVQSLVPRKAAGAAGASAKATTAAAAAGASSSILTKLESGVLTLTLNRPDRYNAFNFDMYTAVQRTLEESNDNADVKTVVITGAGKYYSSGNDLANFMTIPKEGPQKLAADAALILENFVNAYIRFSKPLIAAVNGPAIGIPGAGLTCHKRWQRVCVSAMLHGML